MTTVVADTDKGGLFTISGRQWLILLMVQVANMLFGMTITIANLVLPQMRGNLSASPEEISWVITLNLVATAVATPMTGWLASRLGWRNLMFFTVLGFTVASLLCGLSRSLEALILARVAQGAFGAPIMPMGQAILLATFPKHLQPTAIVIWGIGAVFGPVMGPIVGSIATEAYNWRAAFFLIVPLGIASLVCIRFALRDHTGQTPVKFDWIGFIALSVAMTCAQLVFDRGHRLDWFESREIVLFVFTGALALWVFVVHCLTVKEPFLNPRLLLDRNFSIGLLLALVMGMLNFITIVLYPTLLHDLRGYPDNAVAYLISARGLGNWAAFLVVVQFTRLAPRAAIVTGMAIQAAAGFWMAGFDINLSDHEVFWSNLLMGFGQSIAFTPMTVLAFSTLPPRQVTEGTSVFTLFRNFGSSLFISICVLIISRSTAANYSRMTENITPYNKTLAAPGLPAQWSLDGVGSLMSLSNEILRQAAMIGYVNAFWLIALVAAVAVPLAGLMHRLPRDE
ncbi:DHA2 family efflux MFS transporter permease subunit [Reyranella sp.]|uniref:DHA2 family efflux MFS transporter permease subunit n=1 Tax=Reyranella sp. TaxID=1929291 RepID=UPI003BA988D2